MYFKYFRKKYLVKKETKVPKSPRPFGFAFCPIPILAQQGRFHRRAQYANQIIIFIFTKSKIRPGIRAGNGNRRGEGQFKMNGIGKQRSEE